MPTQYRANSRNWEVTIIMDMDKGHQWHLFVRDVNKHQQHVFDTWSGNGKSINATQSSCWIFALLPKPNYAFRPGQNGRHFADHIFEYIFFNGKIRTSLKFVPKDPSNNIPASVQIMVSRRSGDKPLFEQMMVCFLTHICVAQPPWVNFNHSVCFKGIWKQTVITLLKDRYFSSIWNRTHTKLAYRILCFRLARHNKYWPLTICFVQLLNKPRVTHINTVL